MNAKLAGSMPAETFATLHAKAWREAYALVAKYALAILADGRERSTEELAQAIAPSQSWLGPRDERVKVYRALNYLAGGELKECVSLVHSVRYGKPIKRKRWKAACVKPKCQFCNGTGIATEESVS